jgi:hypothetical protein
MSVFHVLTEFKFEIGEALIKTETLQGAVGGLSNAADQALLSFQKLGMGIVGYMGLGTGSVLGLLNSAMQASDKFGQSQRQLSNIFLSNNMFKGADAFEQAMMNSAQVMEEIKKKAQEFSLPAGEMVQFTKLIGASLISHGLDDSSMRKSMDISRGFLKSAPTLGIDPTLAQGQLLDAVLGRANLGDTLFQRLMNETTAMKQFKGNPKAFNAMPDDKRVKVLTTALLQFGSSTKVLEGNAHSLSGEFQRLKDSLYGMFSILRPIGDMINKFILPSFRAINDYLQKQGAEVMRNVSKLFDGLIKDPKSLYTTLRMLQGAQKDLNIAAKIGVFISMTTGILGLLKWLGVLSGQFTVAGLAMTALRTGMGWLGTGLMAIFSNLGTILPIVWSALNGLVVVLSEALIPIAAIFAVLQFFRAAWAKAQANDAIAFAQMLPKLTAVFLKLKTVVMIVVGPLMDLFDFLAEKASIIFQFSHWLQALVWIIDLVADTLMLAFATIQGVVWGIMKLIENLMAAVRGQGSLNIFKGVGDSFNAGIDEMIASTMDKLNNAEGGVVNQTTNIGHVNINNNFKEQLEPDRIAFTLKEQLMKTAQNPSQSAARSLSGALVGR